MADAAADVVIKINVHDADAKQKLAKLGAELKALGASGNGIEDIGKDLDKIGKEAGKVDNELTKTGRSMDKFGKNAKSAGRASKALENTFESLMKFVKYAGIEFGVMTAGLGALKLALLSAQYIAKGFSAVMRGLGASAGVAVGGLATVLGAIRELQNAKMAPLMAMSGQATTGRIGGQARMAGMLGDPSLGMFKDATIVSSAQAQMRNGGSLNGQYRQMLRTLGDFAITEGDPDKALSGLVSGFSEAQKQGKFTTKSFQAIASASPNVLKGFQDLYGGQKQLDSALAAGTVTADKFFTALSEGQIKSLEPFKGTLDKVNNTLIGRFKGAVKVIKEQLTEMGNPLVQLFKAPIGDLQKDIQVFLMKVTPTVQSVFNRLIPGLESSGGSVISRLLDRLARSINMNMPKLIGFGDRFMEMWVKVKRFFGGLGDSLERMTKPFDAIWNKIIKPLAGEIGKTISYAFKSFGKTIQDNEPFMESFAQRIEIIFEGVRKLIDGFSQLKTALAPFIDTLMTMVTALSQLLKIPGAGFLVSAGLFGGLTGRKMFAGTGKGGGKGMSKGGGLGTSAAAAMFGFGNWSRQKGGWLGTKMGKSGFADAVINYPGMAYGYAREGGAGRLSAMRAAGQEFFQGGVKPFAKAAAPMLISAAAMYVGGKLSAGTAQTSSLGQGTASALKMAGSLGMTGAMLGSMFGGPGVGTAVGAAIGGGVGLLAGAFSGVKGAARAREQQRKDAAEAAKADAVANYKANRLYGVGGLQAQMRQSQSEIAVLQGFDALKKQRKAQETQISGFVENISKTTAEQIGYDKGFDFWKKYNQSESNDMLKKLLKTGTLSSDQARVVESYLANTSQMTDINTKSKGNVSEYTKTRVAELQQQGIGVQRLAGNYNTLSAALGMNASAAEKFADALGIDLKDTFITMTDVIQGLGYSMEKNAEQANRATAAGRIFSDAMASINTEMEKIDQNQRYNAAGDAFFNFRGGSGDEVKQLSADFINAYMEKQTQRFAAGEYTTYSQFSTSTLAGLDAMRSTAASKGASESVLAELDRRRAVLGAQFDKGKKDFGTRMSYDPEFAFGLKAQIGTIGGQIGDKRLGTAEEIIAAAKNATAPGGQIDKYLKASGIEVNDSTRASITNLLLGQIQSQPSAIAEAMSKVVLNVKEWNGGALVTTPPPPSTTTTTNTSNTTNTVNLTVQGSVNKEDGEMLKGMLRKELDRIYQEQLERGGPRVGRVK